MTSIILKLVLISLCSYWPILGVCAQSLAGLGVGSNKVRNAPRSI